MLRNLSLLIQLRRAYNFSNQKKDKGTKSFFLVLFKQKMTATWIKNDEEQDEDEELSEIRHYLEIFKKEAEKCRLYTGNNVYMHRFPYWKEMYPLMNRKYTCVCHVKWIGDNADGRNYILTAKTVDMGDVLLNYYQAKAVVPHWLALYILIRHDDWPIKLKIWRWVANRRMVPLGDW